MPNHVLYIRIIRFNDQDQIVRSGNSRRRYCVLIFNSHLVVIYLICFYMWLRVLTSRKVAIYSDGDNIIIIIIIIGFLVLRWLHWYFVASVGISLVVIPSLNVDGKMVVEKKVDVVRFLYQGFNGSMK